MENPYNRWLSGPVYEQDQDNLSVALYRIQITSLVWIQAALKILEKPNNRTF